MYSLSHIVCGPPGFHRPQVENCWSKALSEAAATQVKDWNVIVASLVAIHSKIKTPIDFIQYILLQTSN